MTPEVQNNIISQFWGIVPMIVLFILIAAILGIGYKILEKKLISWVKKNKAENEQKRNKQTSNIYFQELPQTRNSKGARAKHSVQ